MISEAIVLWSFYLSPLFGITVIILIYYMQIYIDSLLSKYFKIILMIQFDSTGSVVHFKFNNKLQCGLFNQEILQVLYLKCNKLSDKETKLQVNAT